MLTALITIATIASGVIPIGGVVLYALGVLHPLKTEATWNQVAWKPDPSQPDEFAAVFVQLNLKNRTKSTQTLNDLGLIKDPGWPRRMRGRFKDGVTVVPFTEWQGNDPQNRLSLDAGDTRPISATLKGRVIPTSADAAAVAAILNDTTLPFGDDTQLWIHMSNRNFYAKLVRLPGA
jgi:hypothetical protein